MHWEKAQRSNQKSQKGVNPRQGTETFCLLSRLAPEGASQKGVNPRQGTETAVRLASATANCAGVRRE